MKLGDIKIDRVAMTAAAVDRGGGCFDQPGVSLFGCQIDIEPNGTPCDFTSQWSAVRERSRAWSRDDVRSHATAVHYYNLYRRLGINPKHHPPSAANLLIRFAIGDGAQRSLPIIHPAVDAGNVAQAEFLVPVAVLNADAIEGSLLLDVAKPGETLLAFGYEQPQEIVPGQLVLRDNVKVLSEFCYRDGQAQAVTATTRRLQILTCHVAEVPQEQAIAALRRTVELLMLSHHVR